MNYLAHLHLGGRQPADMLGSLYGDFVKGPLQGRWPLQVEAGIRLHRQIDAFTDSHPLVLQAKARFPSERRRYAGILLDLFFDHCLAANWQDYSTEPLEDFTLRVYRALQSEPQLPGRLALIAPRMAEQDWLGSYREFAVLEQVLARRSWSGCISRSMKTSAPFIRSYALSPATLGAELRQSSRARGAPAQLA